MKSLIPIEYVERRIFLLRDQRVMLDVDLAQIYGVTAKRLREQLRRNLQRFPDDFMFHLKKNELLEVAANCGDLSRLKYSPTLPYAFSEHGAIMLASVLNSKIAVKASVQVVRAFVKLRELMSSHKDIVRKINSMEKKYDHQFKAVFDAIRQLMEPTKKKQRPIGFGKKETTETNR